MGLVAVVWAILGIVIFFGSAIFRLALISSGLLDLEITNVQWLVLIVWLVFMLYFEGYKGFYQSFAPRVAARVCYLKDNVTFARLVLAPAFCLGFFGAYKNKMIFAWVFSIGIFSLVVLMKYVPMPWRGIIDIGVVAGLSIGLISIAVHLYSALIKGVVIGHAGVPEKDT